jgi:hypothetical protein
MVELFKSLMVLFQSFNCFKTCVHFPFACLNISTFQLFKSSTFNGIANFHIFAIRFIKLIPIYCNGYSFKIRTGKS